MSKDYKPINNDVYTKFQNYLETVKGIPKDIAEILVEYLMYGEPEVTTIQEMYELNKMVAVQHHQISMRHYHAAQAFLLNEFIYFGKTQCSDNLDNT